MMNLLSWNAQGVGGRHTQAHLKHLLNTHKVSLYVIFEPHISGKKARSIIKRTAFECSRRFGVCKGHLSHVKPQQTSGLDLVKP